MHFFFELENSLYAINYSEGEIVLGQRPHSLWYQMKLVVSNFRY
jgi:hypothetical protein